MIEYKDKQGLIVQKNVQDGEDSFMITSYVYDDFGQLVCVIPPKLFENKVKNVTGVVVLSEAVDKELLFAYHYDEKGRVIEKLVPGGGWTHIVYNRLDQPVLTQNARQREGSLWSFIKYDALGRMVLQGEMTVASQTRGQLQTAADAAAGQYETRTGSVYGYTGNTAFPSVTEAQVNLVNYYDDYAWGVPGGSDPHKMTFVAFGDNAEQQPARGLLTGTAARLLGEGGGDMLLSVHYYDTKNRLVQTHQQNPFRSTAAGALYPVSRTDLTLSFAGEVVSLQVYKRYSDGKPDQTMVTEYAYDHMGRKLHSNHSVNGQGLTLAEYRYDAIGRLQQKRIQPGTYRTIEGTVPTDEIIRSTAVSGTVSDNAGKITFRNGFSVTGGSTYSAEPRGIEYGTTAALQVIDYDYNVRGWLKGVNGGTLNTGENDLFAMSLAYQEDGQYFNGNIRKQSWISNSARDAPARSYTYGYDRAGRILAADYAGGKFTGENYSLSGMRYDKGGNILSLTRRGMTGGTPSAPTFGNTNVGSNTIDQLTYTYLGGPHSNPDEPNSNRLARVSDGVSGNPDAGDFRNGVNTGDDYDYYDDGSLKLDRNKGITGVVYNTMGLVQTMLMTRTVNGTVLSGQTDYLYDATGRKWRKKVYDISAQETSYNFYDGEVQFETSPARGKVNALAHIVHEEGRVIPDPMSGQLSYEYHYKDHLGNLRVAFRQQSQTISTSRLSFEPQSAVEEEATFERVSTSRAAGMAHDGRYAARLKYGAGPGKEVRLVEGETLKASVFAHFERQKHRKTRWAPLPVFDREPVSFDGKTRSRLVLRTGIVLPLKINKTQRRLPDAFMEVTARDTAGNIVFSERRKLTGRALNEWEELSVDYKAQGEETVQVSLVNASREQAAWFDDLTLTQEPPVIVQENHYDPWGLNLAGIEKQGTPDHKYQYNGKEKQSELGLNWLDYGARMYDPQLGRWHAVEPFADLMPGISTYAYAFDNPIGYIDQDGQIPIPIVTGIIGAAGGALYGIVAGKSGKEILAAAAGGFVAGATLGFGSAAIGLAGGAASIWTATAANVAAGSAYIGAANTAYITIGASILGGFGGSFVEQSTKLGLGEQKKYDGNDFILSGVFGMSEIVLGPLGEALGKPIKEALKPSISSSFAKDFAKEFSYQSIKEYRKDLTKQLQRASGGALTSKQARLGAEKLINAAKETHKTILEATIKVVNGVVDVIVNAAGSGITSPPKDMLLEEKKK